MTMTALLIGMLFLVVLLILLVATRMDAASPPPGPYRHDRRPEGVDDRSGPPED